MNRVLFTTTELTVFINIVNVYNSLKNSQIKTVHMVFNAFFGGKCFFDHFLCIFEKAVKCYFANFSKTTWNIGYGNIQ